MATIGKINVLFGADPGGLKKGVDESVDYIGKLRDSIADVNKDLEQFNSLLEAQADVAKAALDKMEVEKQLRVGADFEDFDTGVEEAIDHIDDLGESVDDVSEKIAAASGTVRVKAELEGDVEEQVEKKADKAKKAAAKNKVTFVGEVKDLAAKAAEAANQIAPLAKGVVIPIKATFSGVKQAIASAKLANEAFNLSTDSVKEFSESLLSNGTAANGLRNATVFAFGLARAINAGKEAYGGASESVLSLSESFSTLIAAGSNQKFLTKALSEGGAALFGSATAGLAYKAAMLGVNEATEKLDPKAKAAARGLAAMGLALAQAELASRLSESSVTLFAAALKSSASPMAAVSAFSKTYTRGMEELAAASTAATDRQRAFVRIQALASQVFSSGKGAASSFFGPFTTGFARAREAGEGFVSAVSRGLLGQAKSSSVARTAIDSITKAFSPFAAGFSRAKADGLSFFAAFDRGLTGQLQSIGVFRSAVESIGSALSKIGVAGVFEPLITGFDRARNAGAGFLAATARGVQGQLQSIAAYRAVKGAILDAAEAIYKFGGSIVGVNASTKVGRDAFYALRAAMVAVRSTSADVVSFFQIVGKSASAFFSQLPAGKTVVEAMSSAFAALGQRSSSLASSLPTVGGAIKMLAPFLTVASVASGKFAHSLEDISVEMQSVEQMADRFGATTGEMQILSYAAESARVGMGQLAKASQAFLTNVSKVKIGQLGTENIQEAKFAFDRLGISMEELRNKTPQQVFGLVAEELLKVQDAADRSAIAFDLFGKQAVNVLPALKGLKEAEEDASRLGIVTKEIDFSRLIDAEGSFDRLSQASKAFGRTMVTAFAPIQTGWNNLMAELLGGLSAALGPVRTLFASATKPMQVFMEVVGRIMNIILRGIGVITSFAAAMAAATFLAPAWTALGEAIKWALSYVEQAVDAAQKVADVFTSKMNPSIDESAKPLEKLAFAAKAFVTAIVTGGIASAIMQSFGIQAGAAFTKFAAGIAKVNFASVFGGIIKLLRLLTVNVVGAATQWVASFIVMRVGAIAGFVTPFLGSVAAIITGNAAIATSATVTGYAMAAAWVIGTLGLAAVAVGLIAIYQNFDKLYAFFADFGNNVGKLFTLEGLSEAAGAVAEAIKNAFMTAFNFVSGYFTGFLASIVQAINGIERPEKIEASSASVADVVKARRSQQEAAVRTSMAAASMVGADTSNIRMPVEDTQAIAKSLSAARDDMVGLSLNAAKFGEGGRKAFLAAKADFDKLQNALAAGTLSPEKFEQEAKKIRANLQKNLSLADVLSPEQLQKSAEDMRKAVDGAFAKIREVMRGQDLGSDLSEDKFFPTSDAIKQQAEKFGQQYQDELVRIETALQNGELGKGQSALRAAEQAREEAAAKFSKNMGKVEADVSFANDIRKALEDAFLTPVQKFQKELKKIQENKSLTEAEKSLATVNAQKQMVEGTFGKTAGQSLREKEAMFAEATAKDKYGRTAFGVAAGSEAAGAARASVERTKLDIEKRQAAGLDATPAQALQAGIDKINDVFGEAGKGTAEYNEAIKKNRDSVLQSVGIEKSAVQVRQEANKRLEGLSLSAGEAAQAQQKISDSFMSALGITKTPFEQFSGELDNIAAQFDMAGQPLDKVRESLKGNAKDLELFDRAVKQSRDNLLASLGVEKTAQQAYEEQIKRIEEAENATDPSKKISAEEATKARIAAARKREEALGADTANTRAGRFAQRRREIEEAFGKNGEKNQEAFDSAMKNLRKEGPGATPESPVAAFKESIKELEYMRGSGAIDDSEFAERKLNLQADLQEKLKDSLDMVKPDRRAIEGSDVRSKAGVDTFFRILRGNDNPSLKAQLEIARNTRTLAEASKTPDAAPVLAMIGR